MLQELQAQNDMNQLFSSGGGSSGWGDEQEGGWAGEQEGDWEGGGEGSAASDSEGEWNQVGGRAGGKSASRRGGGASSCRIMVRNMALVRPAVGCCWLSGTCFLAPSCAGTACCAVPGCTLMLCSAIPTCM